MHTDIFCQILKFFAQFQIKNDCEFAEVSRRNDMILGNYDVEVIFYTIFSPWHLDIENVNQRLSSVFLYRKLEYFFILKDLIEYLHLLMIKMDTMCDSCHPCLVQFLNKKFHDSHRVSWSKFETKLKVKLMDNEEG